MRLVSKKCNKILISSCTIIRLGRFLRTMMTKLISPFLKRKALSTLKAMKEVNTTMDKVKMMGIHTIKNVKKLTQFLGGSNFWLCLFHILLFCLFWMLVSFLVVCCLCLCSSNFSKLWYLSEYLYVMFGISVPYYNLLLP